MANTKLTDVAKDLGLKNKDLIDFFTDRGLTVKSSSNLESVQLDILFESLTKKNQIKDIDAYIDGDTYIPSKKKVEEKEEVKKTEAKEDKVVSKTAGESKPKAEAKSEVKTEPKIAAKAETKPEVKAEPKAEAKNQSATRPTNNQNTQSGRPQFQQGQQSGRPAYQNRDGQKQPYQQGQQAGRPQFQQGQQSGRPQYQNRDGQRPQFQQGQQAGRPTYQNRESSFVSRQQQNQPIFTKDGFINVAPQNNQRPGYGGKSAQKRPGQRPQNNNNDFGFGKDKDEGYQNAPKEHFKPTAIVRGQTAKGEVSKKEKETLVIDMRDSNVDLSKYDDRLDNFVPDAVKDVRGGNQKLKKQNNQNQNEKYSKGFKKEAPKVIKKQPVSILVPDEISVGELASRLKVTAGEVVKKLMLMGVMATVNQIIDYDTAYLIADELGAICNKEVVVSIEDKLFEEEEDSAENLELRAPVVCVMGHVDHGKTSLLDAIRNTSVTTGEAGGITQHIGAYRVNINGKDITFLDTPGHEAFTAMRARGAKATDIAILVVAADDGIMPQTVEAINHAKAAGIDIIVAINKMDKPTANPDAIKQELTKYDLVPEEWGGDVICVPVSAKTHKGIDDLLESVLLVAEVKDLKANPNRRAKGIVIEAKLDKGRGPVATVLVQNGTLHSGDIVIAGTAVGKVRVMTDHNGKVQKVAGPSVPVEIIGLADVPMSGDEFNAVEDERMARELADQRKNKAKEEEFKQNARANLNDLFTQISEGVKDLNVIVKADVMGSAEAVRASLEKISNDEVKVRVIHSAVGGITEGDVMLATASNAIIVGFNVRPDKSAIDSAERQKVEIRTYRVIYECIDEITAAMKGMLAPKFKETLLGHAEVRQTIHVPSVGTIAGSYITDGKVTRQSQIRVVRDGIVIFEDKISSLKRFKDDAKEVAEGYECGIGLEKFNDIKINDVLEAFIMEEIKQ